MLDVLSAGIATWDTIFSGIDSDIMEKDGQTAGGYFSASGGDAVNGGIAMARFGVKTAVCACVGNDESAKLIEDDLKQAGVVPCLYRDRNVHTASPVLLLDQDGERHIIRVPDNGNMYFTASMIPEEILNEVRHVHIASANMLRNLDGEPLADLFEKCHQKGITTSLDASYDKNGKWLENIEGALQHCTIFIPSYQEACVYAHSSGIDEIISFFSRWPLKYFGIKLGAEGAVLTDFEHTYRLPTLADGNVVDTTGAGDAFMGGFTASYLLGYDLRSCGLLASAQSAMVLAKTGANKGSGTLEEALEIVRRHGEEVSLA